MKLAGTVLWEEIKTRIHGKKERDKTRKALERVIKVRGLYDDNNPDIDAGDWRARLLADYAVDLNEKLESAFAWEGSPQGHSYWADRSSRPWL